MVSGQPAAITDCVPVSGSVSKPVAWNTQWGVGGGGGFFFWGGGDVGGGGCGGGVHWEIS